MLALVSSLVEKSLLLVDTSSAHARYRLLETIRQFASEPLLDVFEADALRRRHAEHFSKLVQQHVAKLESGSSSGHAAELDRNIDGIRAAQEWANANDSVLLAQSVIAVTLYWNSRCLFRESLSWLTRTLAATEIDRTLRYRLLIEASWVEAVLGQLPVALEHAHEALATAINTRNQRAEATALNYVAMPMRFPGEFHTAVQREHRAGALVRGLVEQQSPTASLADEKLLAEISGNLGTMQILHW